MREVQRHNFEFIRTEILHLSIEEFADKIGVSKSSYQRMKSESYGAEYYFSPIQKACELADISLDIFSTQYITKEHYKNRHNKTQAIVSSKKQLLAFFLFIVIMFSVLLVITAKQISRASKDYSAHVSANAKSAPSSMHESSNIYYWTDKEGGSYHANRKCPMIKNRNNIEAGVLENAQKRKSLTRAIFVFSSKKQRKNLQSLATTVFEAKNVANMWSKPKK